MTIDEFIRHAVLLHDLDEKIKDVKTLEEAINRADGENFAELVALEKYVLTKGRK